MSTLSENNNLNQRTIRVFISSTFRDMKEERDLLIKNVFPELRRICAERLVTFTEVDLRWGITEEQSAEGQVLPICLEEIRLSRPYFIGILGERYGWIPATVPDSVLANESWIKELVENRTSVTELEILHGVLNNPEMAGHAFFYFRDKSYSRNNSEMIERDIPEDIKAFGPVEATRRTEERIAKLAALKERIEKSGLPVVKNYPKPADLAEAVSKQFTELIDKLYPKDETPDPLKQEALGHESYAARKLLIYVPRPTHTAAVDAFVSAESTGKGLVVTGDSGGGKTVLLADWVRQWRKSNSDDFVFVHYFGSTPDSASVPRFLHRLFGELKQHFKIAENIPQDPAKLKDALPLWLAQTVGKENIVLVLDALNQIEGEEPDKRLAWLPRHFPPHVRVIASALPGAALETLNSQGWTPYSLPLPDAEERGLMIDAFLRHYRKELGKELRDQLASAPGSANPLFLRTVLEELRQFGSFEELPKKVDDYLKAKTPAELFQLVIQRWRDDFDAGKNLVSNALRLLWAARMGLSETEWRELLDSRESPLKRPIWSPIFLAIEPHLVLRAGLFKFGHDYLRHATETILVSSPDKQKEVQIQLADYFEHLPQSQRRTFEYPWLLSEARQWSRLECAITERPLIKDIWTRDKVSLMRYLTSLYENTNFMLETAFKNEIYAGPCKPDFDLLEILIYFLRDRGAYHAIKAILATLEGYACLTDDYTLTLSLYLDTAKIQFDMGDLGAAAEKYDFIINMSRKRGSLLDYELQSALYESGHLAIENANFNIAIERLREAKQIAIELEDSNNQMRCLTLLAEAYRESGDFEMAQNCLKEGESISRSVNVKISFIELLNEKAALLAKVKDYNAALLILNDNEKHCREIGIYPQLITTLYQKGNVLLQLNRAADALEAMQEGLMLARFRDKPADIASLLGSIALAHAMLGSINVAMETIEEALDLIHDKRLLHLIAQLQTTQEHILNIRTV